MNDPQFVATKMRTGPSARDAAGDAGAAIDADDAQPGTAVNRGAALRALPADDIAISCPRFQAAISGTVCRDKDGVPATHALRLKLAVLAQLEGGESIGRLAWRLNLRRQLLYDWYDRFRSGGVDALRARGRPPKPSPSADAYDLAQARQRISELEQALAARERALAVMKYRVTRSWR